MFSQYPQKKNGYVREKETSLLAPDKDMDET